MYLQKEKSIGNFYYLKGYSMTHTLDVLTKTIIEIGE